MYVWLWSAGNFCGVCDDRDRAMRYAQAHLSAGETVLVEGPAHGGHPRPQAHPHRAQPTEERAAYRDQTLVTRLGTAHADHARRGGHADGRPTSSATQPGLVVAMYRHAGLTGDVDVLDIGTGSGYGCALLARRLGAHHVTSVDIDDYLVKAAAERLASAGAPPRSPSATRPARCRAATTASCP